MPKVLKQRTENENRKLLSHIEERMKLMHEGLESLYMRSDETTADLIHGVRKHLYLLKGIFFDLLIDEMPARKILEDRR